MLTPIDHALFVVLAVLFPLWAAVFGMRRLRRASPTDRPSARLWLYRRAMLIQWGLTLALLGYWLGRGRPFAGLGLVPRVTGGLIGVAAGLAIMIVLVWKQRREALADDEALARVRERLGKLELIIPRGAHERSWFYGLSITAGICEEVLYRGYLVWYLGHAMALLPAAALAGVLFGIGHAYQGPRGVLVTGLVGLFLGAIYILTGSLYAGMAMHALMDVHSGHLGSVALDRAEERALRPVVPSVDAAEPAIAPDADDEAPEGGAA